MDKNSSSYLAQSARQVVSSSSTITTPIRNLNSISNIPNPVQPPDYNDLIHSTIPSRNDNLSDSPIGANKQDLVNNKHFAVNTNINTEIKQSNQPDENNDNNLSGNQSNSMGTNASKQSTTDLLVAALNKA